ncbi:MAG: DUF3347 domain-containing protein [Balneolaceae bacterium]|nr:MAG: DUF3347 domain-containing protein [Balneolaceae bacterium]
MKTILFFSLTLLLVACGPSEQEQAQQQERQMQMLQQAIETTPEFDSQMAELLDNYFDLKDALVQSDAASASAEAELFADFTASVEFGTLLPETAALWVGYSDVIQIRSREMIPLSDVDDQRYHFEYISEVMIEMVDLFRPVGYAIYHQSCPMVRDGSADWLSREEQIANPYHGDRMMRCGEVIRRL